MYEHFQNLELAFFDSQQTGQLMSRATVDLQSVRFFLGYGLVFMLQSALTILLSAVAMFIVNPPLAAISLAPVPFVVFVAARYGRRSRPALQEVQQRLAELTAEVEENVSGVRVVKAFAAEARQRRRFERQVGRVFEQAMVSTRIQAFYGPFIGFLPQLGLAAVLFVGGRQVINGTITLGQFSAFYTYLLMLIGPMRTLGISLGMAQRATASGARLFQILDREPQITARPGAGPLPAGQGRVEFRDATLRYDGATRAAVERRDARRRAPARPSRSSAPPARARRRSCSSSRGSTTSPPARCSSTASTCATSTPRRCARRSRSSPTTRSCSRRRCARTSPTRAPTRREDEVEAAARRAQADGFIERLPDGYETRVGERGLTLSGGQRQRLAIARALLADPRILILDDATSSVDASTEQQIKDALQRGDDRAARRS